MKKPIIVHIIPSLMIGGAEKLLHDLLTNFQQNPNNSYTHQVIYFQPGPFLIEIKKLKIKTYQITGLIKYYDPICFLKLLSLIHQIKPYKLHSSLWTANFYTNLVGKILKIPVICTIHSYYNDSEQAQDHFLKKMLDNRTLKWASKIICVSPYIAAKLTLNPHLNPQQIKLINNGVNLPKIKKGAQLLNHKFTIGHVGRLVPVKNQALIIQALSLVRTSISDFEAIIIGTGPLEKKLKELAKQLNLEKQLRFIQTNQPQNYYLQFDCFVLCSKQEGQSLALLEAMSFGIAPIIISENREHDVVTHLKNGLICPTYNAQELAQNILKLYYDQGLKKALSHNADLTIRKQFNFVKTASQYLNLY